MKLLSRRAHHTRVRLGHWPTPRRAMLRVRPLRMPGHAARSDEASGPGHSPPSERTANWPLRMPGHTAQPDEASGPGQSPPCERTAAWPGPQHSVLSEEALFAHAEAHGATVAGLWPAPKHAMQTDGVADPFRSTLSNFFFFFFPCRLPSSSYRPKPGHALHTEPATGPVRRARSDLPPFPVFL